ncbi:hypothetical protein [Streptomyces sp. NPDC051211]|uniref:hypothetical protein n=1 Tax=Streptomyces sp. NPDC051211 TaxID=3154643 RepID=UPI00344F6D99
MRKHGIDWPVVDPGRQMSTAEMNAGRYGIVDRAEVARWGYRNPADEQHAADRPAPDRPGAPQPQPQPQPQPSERPAAQLAVWTDTCAREAQQALTGDAPVDTMALVLRLRKEAEDSALADPRLRGAFAAWSACMERSGYRYADPWQANDDAGARRSRAGDRQRGEREDVAMALADLDCRAEHRVTDLWYALDRAYQRRLVDRHRGELDRSRAHLAEVRKRTARILAGS